MSQVRQVRNEDRQRSVLYQSGNWYRFEQRWHTLDNGDEYHYIHVYKGIFHRPVKRFAWVVSNGEFKKWVYPTAWNEGTK